MPLARGVLHSTFGIPDRPMALEIATSSENPSTVPKEKEDLRIQLSSCA